MTSKIVKYNEVAISKLVSKPTLKKQSFKKALAGIRAEENKRRKEACFVKLERLSSAEISDGCGRETLEEAEQREKAREPKLRLEDLIPKPFDFRELNIPFDKLDPSFRQFLGFNMNFPPVAASQAKIGQETCSPFEFVLPPSEIANFNTIVEWQNYVCDLLVNVKNPAQKRLLEGTYKMVEITIFLEHALYSDNPNLSYALKLLNDLKYKVWPRVDVSKLQQIPDAVDIIRNACQYVGKVKKTSSKQEVELKIIELIKKLASEIYSFIKVINLFRFLILKFLKQFISNRLASRIRRKFPSNPR